MRPNDQLTEWYTHTHTHPHAGFPTMPRPHVPRPGGCPIPYDAEIWVFFWLPPLSGPPFIFIGGPRPMHGPCHLKFYEDPSSKLMSPPSPQTFEAPLEKSFFFWYCRKCYTHSQMSLLVFTIIIRHIWYIMCGYLDIYLLCICTYWYKPNKMAAQTDRQWWRWTLTWTMEDRKNALQMATTDKRAWERIAPVCIVLNPHI